MDPVLPFRALSPSTHNPKISQQRNRDTKLSLKTRKVGVTRHVGKENRAPLTPPNCKITNFRQSDSSELITSDDSDSNDLDVGTDIRQQSILTLNSQESTFSTPVAESTRCELPARNKIGQFESTMASLHTARNGSSSSSGTEYYTAYPFPTECDVSIVCISDSSPESVKKTDKRNNIVSASVLLTSDESECQSPPQSTKKNIFSSLRKCDVKKKLCDTVILESTDDEDCSISVGDNRNCDIVIPPSLRSDNSSCSSLVSGTNSRLETDGLVIPPSPERNSEMSANGSLLSEDGNKNSSGLHKIKVSKDRATPLYLEERKQCDQISGPGKSQDCPRETDLTSSSWKDDFRLFMEESAVSGKDYRDFKDQSLKESSQKKMTGSISKEKYKDIARWLISGSCSESNSDGSTSCDKRHSKQQCDKRHSKQQCDNGYLNQQCDKRHLKQQCDKRHSKQQCDNTPDDACSPQLSRLPGLKTCSSGSESDDNFEALMASIRKKRNEDKRKPCNRDNPSRNDSFIDDGVASDVVDSPASTLNIYHSDLTKSIKAEVKYVKKSVKSVQKKKLFEYEDDNEENKYTPIKVKPIQGLKNQVSCFVEGSFLLILTQAGAEFNSLLRGKLDLSNMDSEKSRSIPKNSKKPQVHETDTSDTSDSECGPPPRNKASVNRKPKIKKGSKQLKTPRNIASLKSPQTPYSPIRTFLSSLSGPTHEPGIRDHPEAAVYNRNFKGKKEELTRRLFKLFNREVFDRRLPDDMVLEWNARLVRTAGLCYCKLIRKGGVTSRTAKIDLSTKVITSPDRLRDTLIHEMCHAAVWLLNNVSGGHGPFWKAWAHKAMKRFPELPPIQRCHSYNIETKFTYRCTKCGYSFGRHSKSLDLDKKRCGYCYGTFEVFLSSKRRS
ncbi:Acidic repeat-containing protein [Frankliniella fusca]|uniref:Acidic repeat-containing protein n=1 Tax=Frankliniella fusca TaxID=407009 RepID=A0AAE1H6Y8_9NEOP|nr:Acidic repeat-containing protein [Frankliniella fusca]